MHSLTPKLLLALLLGLFYQVVLAQKSTPMTATQASEKIVRAFLQTVRSGNNPDAAGEYLAGKVLAHQLNAENMAVVERTPQQYAEHVKEFLKMYGPFGFEITELIAQGDKVYARWKQTGKHLAEIDGHAATGQPLVELASAVYRVENGKIAEYWIQIDRLGFEKQLQSHAHPHK
jgi:predicted ester cyclase